MATLDELLKSCSKKKLRASCLSFGRYVKSSMKKDELIDILDVHVKSNPMLFRSRMKKHFGYQTRDLTIVTVPFTIPTQVLEAFALASQPM